MQEHDDGEARALGRILDRMENAHCKFASTRDFTELVHSPSKNADVVFAPDTESAQHRRTGVGSIIDSEVFRVRRRCQLATFSCS